MSDEKEFYYTQWQNGKSAAGRSAVWSDNNIIPNAEFTRKTFTDGYAKRCGDWNKVVLTPTTTTIIGKPKGAEGVLYIHGKNTPYYSGNIIYDTLSERFSAEFTTIDYPKFSDSITLRRISTAKSDAGLVIGSIEKEQVKDAYDKLTVISSNVYIKRFEYQSITKASLDQESKFRRDTYYYSMVFDYLYERGEQTEFEKKFCCSRCGQYYYTGALMPENNSKAIAYRDDPELVGHFYTIDTENKEKRIITNTLHSQYIDKEEIDNLTNYRTIQNTNADVTKQEYDYRILFYPNALFGTSLIHGYQGSLEVKECECTYGLTNAYDKQGITVKEFAKKNKYAYSSYFNFFANLSWMSGLSEPIVINTKEDAITQIARTTSRKDTYGYKAVSWHHSEGVNYADPNVNGGAYSFGTGKTDTGAGVYYGVFYTDTGDDKSSPCSSIWAGLSGNDHGLSTGPIGKSGYSKTTNDTGHFWKAFDDTSLEYVNFDYKYLTADEDGNLTAGEFLADPDNSIPLSDQDMADEGLSPNDQEDSVEETKEEIDVMQMVDPFYISYLRNYTTKSIEREIYIPHVFINRQEYEEIDKTDAERMVSFHDNNIKYETKKLISKSNDGSDGSAAGDYVKVLTPPWADSHIVDIADQYYTIVQTYKSDWALGGTLNFGWYYRVDFDLPNGSKIVRLRDPNKQYNLGPDYMRMEDLFYSPQFPTGIVGLAGNDGGYRTSEGRQFRDANQRLSNVLADWSFFSVGGEGLANSVFNNYIFTDFLPDSSDVYEVNLGLNHDKFMRDNPLIDGEIPPLFEENGGDTWKKKKEELQKTYAWTVTLQVSAKSENFTCPAAEYNYWDEKNGQEVSFPKACKYINHEISIAPRYIQYSMPWEFIDAYTNEKGTFETYGIAVWDNFALEGEGELPYDLNDYYKNYNSITGQTSGNFEPPKKDSPEELSPYFDKANLPDHYYINFNDTMSVFSTVAEYNTWYAPDKKQLQKMGYANYQILRPWSSSIVTGYGCCPKRANNKYLLFGDEGKEAYAAGVTDGYRQFSKPWDCVHNTPSMQNRFHSTGTTYVNFLSEGLYPHPDGTRFIQVSPWMTDFVEGFAGIQLQSFGLSDFANGKFSGGFNIPCDTALITTIPISMGTVQTAVNIFSQDKESSSKYTVNKGIFPVIKGLWTPDVNHSVYKNVEYALFGIETQCMIEGPEYYFSTSEDEYPPGFEKNFTGYKSRGLIVSICKNGEHKNYIVDGEASSFFKYFEEQNKKRDKINLRRAHDTHPDGMREEEGYYWDCEEAFGIYEIASPYTFETQLAAKMSFAVRVGDTTAVLFLLAYDIDKWPCEQKDMPTFDKSFPEIYPEEQYAFKAAHLQVDFLSSGRPINVPNPFKDFVLKSVLRRLSEKKKYSNKKLKEMGKKYFVDPKTKKQINGIIVHKSYDETTFGYYKGLPEYNLDTTKTVEEELEHRRGIVQLVRWRTFDYKAPKRNKDGTYKLNKDGDIDESDLVEYRAAIAECALSYSDPRKTEDLQYYTGKETFLLHFYKEETASEVNVECLHIPEQMVWLEDKSTTDDIEKNKRNYDEHLLKLTKLGIFDIVSIEKEKNKEKQKEDEKDTKKFDALVIPVMADDGQTYVCVSKDCKNWEIASKVGSGFLSHSAVGEKPKEEDLTTK